MSLSARLAALHAEAFAAPWPPSAFDDLLVQPETLLIEQADGFILLRVVADEAEILTLAVRPHARRVGVGGKLVEAGATAAAARGAARLFLEVAEDNAAARALYDRCGFAAVGRRRGYYPRPDGSTCDALVLERDLSTRLS